MRPLKDLLLALCRLLNVSEYSREKPYKAHVYVCRRDGVWGIVRAKDFDDEVIRMRRLFRKDGWPHWTSTNLKPVRPMVSPVFLFSDKTPAERNFLVGNVEKDLDYLLAYCRAEFRDFELPPMNAGGLVPCDYHGGVYEQTGREGSRVRCYSLEQCWKHLGLNPSNQYFMSMTD